MITEFEILRICFRLLFGSKTRFEILTVRSLVIIFLDKKLVQIFHIDRRDLLDRFGEEEISEVDFF